MAEKKVTEMILKADLNCECCYKRVRKLLSKYPEIRDWIFHDDSNTVTITVTGGDPERLRYMLCRNGRGVIKSIEIKQPEEPAPAAQPPKLEEVAPQAKAEPVQKPPEPAPETPEPVQIDSAPVPKVVEPEFKSTGPVEIYGSGQMPSFCKHCHGGRMIGPWNNGFGGPPVYFEGHFYGRIGFGFGPSCSNQCYHPNPAGGRFT